MVHKWLSQDDGKTNNIAEDTRIIALHVLTAAGFGITQDFADGSRKPTLGHEFSLRDSLLLILANVFDVLAGLWKVALLRPILSAQVNKIGRAVIDFGRYMDEILHHEREARIKNPGSVKTNLISSLIRASDDAKEAPGVNSSMRLSDDEIKGNIFIFHLAGHDTTANTLAYTFTLLALYPEFQEWLAEEIREVVSAAEKTDYESSHPKLKRCMAVMVREKIIHFDYQDQTAHSRSSMRHSVYMGQSQLSPAAYSTKTNLSHSQFSLYQTSHQ